MNTRLYPRLAAFLLALFGFGVVPELAAITLDDLKQSDDFRAKVYLKPDKEITVSQEVMLVIELATTGWFAAGTEIEIPEIPNVVVTQRSEFASNSTHKESGKTWTVQSKELSLFPQAEGVFKVPSLTLGINLSVPRKGVVRGKIQTNELRFTAAVPDALREISQWRATPNLSIEQQWNKPLDSLKPGDAIRQTIHFKGEQLLAMMLPNYLPPEIEGLASYPKLPELLDFNNRGQKRGERIDVIDYIIETEGEFEIPTRNFHWWNTAEKQLESVTLPATRFVVGQGVASAVEAEVPEISVTENSKSVRNILLAALAIVVIGLMLAIIWRRSQSLKSGSLSKHAVLKKIRQASLQGDPTAMMHWLYLWLDRFEDNQGTILLRDYAKATGDSEFASQIDAALVAAYSKNNESATADLRIKAGKSKRYLDRIKQLLSSRIRLKLNP